ncbi:spherulin 1b precursor [Fusarium heterosporum]|uniref:Spherulin 1b n=1 Tax=Fusarium heterosporum TaxID=42747 RepID=A0A8H5TYW1_FUSHE|nr:spherulin 1b precursor [Fusarium heterosporum]
MFSNAFISATTAILACSSFASAAPQNKSAPEVSLTTKLRLADSYIDRYKLLPEDKDFFFDFNDTDGGIATSQSFPALTGTGISLAMAQLPGCSMIMIHAHPRASELFSVISGRIYTEAIPESRVLDSEGKPRVIKNELTAGQATIFYQGTLHYQVNSECEPASALAAFSDEDAGVLGIAPALFSADKDALLRTFGEAIDGEDIDKVRGAIPVGVTIKVEECLAKCGKQKRKA